MSCPDISSDLSPLHSFLYSAGYFISSPGFNNRIYVCNSPKLAPITLLVPHPQIATWISSPECPVGAWQIQHVQKRTGTQILFSSTPTLRLISQFLLRTHHRYSSHIEVILNSCPSPRCNQWSSVTNGLPQHLSNVSPLLPTHKAMTGPGPHQLSGG